MQDRRGLIAGSVWVGLFVLGGLSLVVAVDGSPSISHYQYAVEGLIFSVVMSVLGAIILVHRPRQPIGLVLFIAGIAAATQFGAGEYAVFADASGWLLGAPAAWLATVLRTPVFAASVPSVALPLRRLLGDGSPAGGRCRCRCSGRSGGLALIRGPRGFSEHPKPLWTRALRSGSSPLEVVESVGILPAFWEDWNAGCALPAVSRGRTTADQMGLVAAGAH